MVLLGLGNSDFLVTSSTQISRNLQQRSMEQTSMPGSSLAVLEETKNLVMGELDLALKVATAPQVSLGQDTATRRLPLLAYIRHATDKSVYH